MSVHSHTCNITLCGKDMWYEHKKRTYAYYAEFLINFHFSNSFSHVNVFVGKVGVFGGGRIKMNTKFLYIFFDFSIKKILGKKTDRF